MNLNQKAKESPVFPVVKAGIWTYCKEAAEKPIAPVPTILSTELVAGDPEVMPLYVEPPEPRFITVDPETVAESKE